MMFGMKKIWTAEDPAGINWVAIEDKPWWYLSGTRKRRYWARTPPFVWHDNFNGDKLCTPKKCAELKEIFEFNKNRIPLEDA